MKIFEYEISLILQVTVLLKECRDIQLRCGSDSHESDEEMVMDAFELNEESDIEKIIRERLVSTWVVFLYGICAQNHSFESCANLEHLVYDAWLILLQLTFKDIHGLVEQNVKLRSLVRNLSHQIDDQEAEFKVATLKLLPKKEKVIASCTVLL